MPLLVVLAAAAAAARRAASRQQVQQHGQGLRVVAQQLLLEHLQGRRREPAGGRQQLGGLAAWLSKTCEAAAQTVASAGRCLRKQATPATSAATSRAPTHVVVGGSSAQQVRGFGLQDRRLLPAEERHNRRQPAHALQVCTCQMGRGGKGASGWSAARGSSSCTLLRALQERPQLPGPPHAALLCPVSPKSREASKRG